MEIQTALSQLLTQFVSYLPFGYAFGAGMVSAVNPCGFFMLPVYLSLYLGAGDGNQEQNYFLRSLRAMWVCCVVTVGFGLVFAIAGGIISAGGYFLMGIMPWFALLIGAMLSLFGVMILAGKTIASTHLHALSAKVGDLRDVSTKGFFYFGLAYGTASLGCALPIFLALIGGSVATGGASSAVGQFFAYILGMSSILCLLTLGIVFVKKQAILGIMHKILPHTQKITAFFLLAAGIYIMYYWITSGLLALS